MCVTIPGGGCLVGVFSPNFHHFKYSQIRLVEVHLILERFNMVPQELLVLLAC